MARRALHHKGNVTEFVKVHSLCSPGTWIRFYCIPYWIISPRHKIKLI